MPAPRPIRWLHLSDLHLGCRGEDLWWQMQEEWEPSVKEMARRLGPPDLLLISGDLANRGAPEEYAKVDRLLDTLLGWLRDATGAPDPLIVAIPGNHDLQRPQGRTAFAYRVLERYDQGAGDEDVRTLDEELWDRRDASFVEPLFSGYQEWFRRRLLLDLQRRAKKLHLSRFPGDFCLELEIEGAFPLCLVGLNSTWQQYRGGSFEGKLTIPARQFQAALEDPGAGNPLEVFKRHPRALLMMHHPPGWLSRLGCRAFDEAIYPANRFDLCLFGHMHEGRTLSVAVSGGTPRYYFQAPSLFGLEHYGTLQEDRLFGYAWGTLAAGGEVRIWPLARVTRGDGRGAFVHDQRFPEDAKGVVIRPGARPARALKRTKPPAAPKADFRSYLESLIDHTDHINISGISSAGKGALRYPIERLYMPLRSRAEFDRMPGGEARALADGRMGLADLLPRHERLLLEGQPGAGKTTFLRFAACMLARDALGSPCPDGGSWRRRWLGLGTGRPWLPVFLRIADLLPLLAEDTGLRRDDRRRLLDLLERSCVENEHLIPRDSWRSLLESGLAGEGAILLLDGLDEVADEDLRARVFDVFRDACRKWKCPIVVTSRPIQTAALREMGFHTAVIEPFGETEIRAFLDHWVAGLHAAEDPEALHGEAERYRTDLVSAICDLPRVRRLATNPVMLTCLCVVHWNEGHLPEGRSRVYRAVIKWLIASRTALRETEGFTDRFAWNAFARLALAMVGAEGGKKTVFDLEDGAVAIDSAVLRQFPDLPPDERRREARRWLRFECLGSGIVEEVPGNRLRFWHLTFQEFLAALQLAWMDDGESKKTSWWPLVRQHLDHAQWRETVELLPGCLLDEGGEGRVDRLLDRVLALRGKTPPLAAKARIAGIAGRLLQSLSAYQYRPRPEISRAYEDLLDQSMAIFRPEGAARVPVKARIAAAEALGQGGDPRLAPDQDNFLEVPGLGGLRLGRYPVTVEEYQRFVESRGYEEPRFWDADGWGLREKEDWEAPGSWEEQLETPNRPVTEVSWYEADAYCRWLSEQKGVSLRLPTEAEREKAATPVEGEYPWGVEDPDPERANYDGAVGRPTPVGIYPAGDGRFGHCDLAGNVWEWCKDDLGLTRAEAMRPLRGGDWYFSAAGLRAAFRNGFRARGRDGYVGFRVAAAPASP